MPKTSRRVRRKSTYRRKKSNIAGLVKRNTLRLNKLTRQQFRLSQYSFRGEGTATIETFPLIQPNLWNPIFQSNFRANNTDRCFINNIHLLVNITVGQSGDLTFSPIHYCLFIVSIKPEAKLQTLQRISPLANNLTEDIDYTYNTIGATVGQAQWRLNPAIYNIHGIRRGMVGNYAFEDLIADAQPVTNIADANRNHKLVIPWKRRIKRVQGQDANNQPLEWKDMTVNEVNPADQLYAFFFNNSEITQQVDIAWSLQANCKVPQ